MTSSDSIQEQIYNERFEDVDLSDAGDEEEEIGFCDYHSGEFDECDCLND